MSEWTGAFSKQEAASLCLERRGISLRITPMKSLVGTNMGVSCDYRVTRNQHLKRIIDNLLMSTAGINGRFD